jgi:hypothetical protein
MRINPQIRNLIKLLVTPFEPVYYRVKRFCSGNHPIGMITTREAAFYQNYIAHHYLGSGAIVDLGTWLGSTTIALSKGLSLNANSTSHYGRIYAFDIFIWQPYMDWHSWKSEVKRKFKVGECFIDEYKKRVRSFQRFLTIEKVDLLDVIWVQGPIEILLIDSMKSWELASAIQRSFFTHLIPGVSVVIHQDFCHFYTYWIHLLGYRLRDYFKVFDEGNIDSTLAFRLVKPIPQELLERAYSLADFTVAEIDHAFTYSLSLVGRDGQAPILAARILCYKEKNELLIARSLAEQAFSDGYAHHDLDVVARAVSANSQR